MASPAWIKAYEEGKRHERESWRSRIQERIDELHLQIAKVNNPVANYALSKQVEELDGLLGSGGTKSKEVR